MAQLEGGTSDSGCPSLESWVQEKKITQNLYNHLTSVEPAYTVELLLIMSQADVKGLRNDFKNVNLPEILQLINLLKKMPQSQIYQDMINQQQQKVVIYLTPEQHTTINKLKTNLTNISEKMHNAKQMVNKNKQQRDTNILLINNTFDELIKLLNAKKLSLIEQVTKICSKNSEILSQQESGLKKLYQTTLDIKNQFTKFAETTDMTSHESVRKEKEINNLIKKNENEIQVSFNSFDKVLNELDNNNESDNKQDIDGSGNKGMIVGGYNISVNTHHEMEKMVDSVVTIKKQDNLKKIKHEMKFVPHTCCKNKVILSNNDSTCQIAVGADRNVFYGTQHIPVGTSRFRMTIDDGECVGIGFVPPTFSASLDTHTIHKDKASWIVYYNGTTYVKSVQENNPIRFGKNDSVVVECTMIDNAKNSSKVSILNETNGKKCEINEMSYPLRLVFSGYSNPTITCRHLS